MSVSLLTSHAELDDLGGGRYRHTQHLRAIAYREAGALVRSVHDWGDGDANLPHLVSRAPMMVSAGAAGKYRIYPTRALDRYIELSQWVGAGFQNPVRSGNTLTFSQSQGKALLKLAMGGHFLKVETELLGGYIPPNSQFAWPITLVGLTRQGSDLLADGVLVAHLRAPNVYDAANPLDVRPISLTFGSIGGQTGVLFTLPSLAGMSRPVVDPTLSLQPDATDGVDAFIREAGATTNFGTNNSLVIGWRGGGTGIERSLIKFNLSSLPNGAIISSAILSLYVVTNSSSNATTYRVFRQKRVWVESQATWNIYSTGNNWQTAGGFGADDCEQADIGSRAFSATETINEFKDFALNAITKAALDLGNGHLLKSDNEVTSAAYLFASSDHATAANRPKLVIEYTLPGKVHMRAPGRGRW